MTKRKPFSPPPFNPQNAADYLHELVEHSHAAVPVGEVRSNKSRSVSQFRMDAGGAQFSVHVTNVPLAERRSRNSDGTWGPWVTTPDNQET